MGMIVEDEYDFLVNAEGEVMLVLNEYKGSPDGARLIIKDASMVLLQRSQGDMVRLEMFPPEMLEKIEPVKEILVSEMKENGDFGHTYSASVMFSETVLG
jgi:hypothetical protein